MELYDYAEVVAFLAEWVETHGSEPVTTKILMPLAKKHGMHLKGKTDRIQTFSLGHRLADLSNRKITGFNIHKYGERDHTVLWTVEKIDEEQPPDEEHEKLQDTITYLRSCNAQLDSEVNALHKSLGEQAEIANAVSMALQAMQSYPRTWKAPSMRADKPYVIPVFLWSDWHIGEIVDPAQTEGFGEYNWSIAQDRFFSILDDQLKWVSTNRHGYQIDEAAVLSLGDYISGSIHRELERYAEFDPPVQAVNAGKLMAEGLNRMNSHFEKITVKRTMGNHDRMWLKPQHKGRATNSWAFVVYSICDGLLKNCKGIDVPDPISNLGAKHVVEINGQKFLIEHGDTFLSWMGIPYYGIERGLGREARKRMNTDKTFEKHCIAHFHVPALISDTTFVNGSLSGTNEHDHNNGRHADPAQVAFMVSKHHIFDITPFHGGKKTWK